MTEKSFKRPKGTKDKDELEARGLWLAIKETRRISESNEKITISTILHIHKVFFKNVNPDMAGRFRRSGEDIKKLKCIEPPPGSQVSQKMYEFWRVLDTKLSQVPRLPPKHNKKELLARFKTVLDIVAWAHHSIGAIHPFCEGNGRMARLLTNLILQRHNYRPIDVRYLGVAKEKYLDAMCQVDKSQNYEALKILIARSVYQTYKKLKRWTRVAQ